MQSMPPDLHVNQVAESETASARMFVAIEPLRDGVGNWGCEIKV